MKMEDNGRVIPTVYSQRVSPRMKVISGWPECVLVGQNNFRFQTINQIARLAHATTLW